MEEEREKNLTKNNRKDEIKNEIYTKINNFLIKNKLSKIDNLTVINLNNKVSYLGNIPLFDYNLVEIIETQLGEILNNYGTYSIRTEEVISCCKPAYKNISFKVSVNI